jgi:hypothetical protein
MFWNPFPSNKNKLKWEATQEGFISFINFFEALHAFKSPDDTHMTANEIAAVFMTIIKVDISPYPDFETMRMSVQPEVPLEEMIMKMLAVIEEDLRLEDALDGTGVLLSEEEQIRLLVRNFLTNEFINDMSKFVSFPE